jgi:hypothetical protein
VSLSLHSLARAHTLHLRCTLTLTLLLLLSVPRCRPQIMQARREAARRREERRQARLLLLRKIAAATHFQRVFRGYMARLLRNRLMVRLRCPVLVTVPVAAVERSH